MDKRILKLIDMVYESLVNKKFLSNFIKDLSIATNSAVGTIYTYDPDTNYNHFLCGYGISINDFIKCANSHHNSSINLFNQESQSMHYIEGISTPVQEIKAPACSSIFSPLGLNQYASMFIGSRAGHCTVGIFARNKSQSCYNSNDKNIFETLMPHCQRAFKIRKNLKKTKTDIVPNWHLLNYHPFGILIFNNKKKLVYENHTAGKICNNDDGLTFKQTGLGASVHSENKKLQQIISEHTNPISLCSKSTYGSNLLISRPSGKRPYMLQITSIPAASTTNAFHAAAIIFIQDLDDQATIPIEPIKNLYNLTTMEARVAVKITQGKSLELCAHELGHTVPTSRNLLKKVFAKTGTGRQNQLVSLLLNSPLTTQMTIQG